MAVTYPYAALLSIAGETLAGETLRPAIEEVAMRRKDFGLMLSLGILLLLAILSPKNILIAEGYAVSPVKLDAGRVIYEQLCSHCHDTGRHGAPAVGDLAVWEKRLKKGIFRVIENATQGCRGKNGHRPSKGGAQALTADEVAVATAYMIAATNGDMRRPGVKMRQEESSAVKGGNTGHLLTGRTMDRARGKGKNGFMIAAGQLLAVGVAEEKIGVEGMPANAFIGF